MLQTKKVKYQDGNIVLEGYSAVDDKIPGKKPAILVAHDWSGHNDFANKKAEELATLGYIAFALDMYGIGKTAKTKEEKITLMTPLIDDRAALRERVCAAFSVLKNIPDVDSARIGAMGFCFGGLCVLDLARSGADVKAVVSFHGLLHSPPHLPNKKIQAKVLALHGYGDPMVPMDQVKAFEKEMTEADVDWQLHTYGKAMHAFMNPDAQDVSSGTIYNPVAAGRAWFAMKHFFEEVL